MGELQTATVIEPVDCSWSSIVQAIRKYAATQPPETASELNDWADLLQGAQELDPENRP